MIQRKQYQIYRELIPQVEVNPEEALSQIHVLSKQEFMLNRNHYLSENTQLNKLILNRTGGSTGEPVSFYLDRITVEHYEAARWRGLSWHGIKIGDPSVMVWGSPIELTQYKNRIFVLKERFLKNRIIIPAFSLNRNSITEYLKLFHRFKPSYIYGYASALYQLAKLMIENSKLINYQLKGVVSTAEVLHDYQRTVIEEAFGCRTINEYGARDGGIIAYECSYGAMHLQIENFWIETFDLKSNKPISNAQLGQLVITDLNNLSMPRIRYQLGDLGVISNNNCPCGINLPIIERIEGRIDEIFVALDGTHVHGQFFSHILRNINEVKQFQIVQHAIDHISINIVFRYHCNQPVILNFIRKKIKERMGNLTITFNVLDEIPLSDSGKLRTSIREIPI